MQEYNYLSVNDIIEYNAFAITIFDVKKADKVEVLSKTKIQSVLDNIKKTEGDIYLKSALLLKGLIKAHAFASGNRRTALIATMSFLKKNKSTFKAKNEEGAKVLTGIREEYYTIEEIKEWIKNGKIKEFKR